MDNDQDVQASEEQEQDEERGSLSHRPLPFPRMETTPTAMSLFEQAAAFLTQTIANEGAELNARIQAARIAIQATAFAPGTITQVVEQDDAEDAGTTTA